MTYSKEDPIWNKYENVQIFEALKSLTQRFKTYVEDQDDSGKKDNFDIIVDRIRRMFDHQEIIENYSKHINALTELFDLHKGMKLKEVLALEEQINEELKKESNLKEWTNKLK